MTKRRPTGPTRHEPPEMFYVGAAIFAVVFVLFNLLADVLYGLLDPRIRYD